MLNKSGVQNMTKTTDDLVREINELRTELQQMREILNVLFNIVVETDGEEEDDYPGYPGSNLQEQPRFNN